MRKVWSDRPSFRKVIVMTPAGRVSSLGVKANSLAPTVAAPPAPWAASLSPPFPVAWLAPAP